jgi:hypothetical protein
MEHGTTVRKLTIITGRGKVMKGPINLEAGGLTSLEWRNAKRIRQRSEGDDQKPTISGLSPQAEPIIPPNPIHRDAADWTDVVGL